MTNSSYDRSRSDGQRTQATTEECVPSLTTQARTALNEATTLAKLSRIKQALIELKHSQDRERYQQVSQQYSVQIEALTAVHKQRKAERDRKRLDYNKHLQGNALAAALTTLTQESQQDSREKRQLKQAKREAIAPLAKKISQLDQQIDILKKQYSEISQQWQTTLQKTFNAQAIDSEPLAIVYQDDALIVIDKPSGLLSVPGRRYYLQDSVITRLRNQLPGCEFLRAVHRLDQATSGLLVVACSADAHRLLSQQFAQNQVRKTYEAILSRPVQSSSGTVDLPLWGNPEDRPKQSVDFQRGKPSCTEFSVLNDGNCPRVEFYPRTGRTHQLRGHAADSRGLNSPILGDTLYGSREGAERMCLHAITLKFLHPFSKASLHFSSNAPF
ncbi:MAG: RluA family pseudouridine synthase [Cyanobacteria bacterium J06632_3]